MTDSPKPKENKPLPPVSRSKFFFEDSMMHIQIENMQFKVHKSKLIPSETFSDMFAVAETSNTRDQHMEGFSEDHPIKLEGVSASDFECLLTFLYEREQHPYPDISLVLPAFRLTHMWNFTELRAYLQPHLERSLNDVDKIVYAREFGIEEWVTPTYIKLYRRPQPLNSEEVDKIGFTAAMLIFRLREERYATAYQQCCGQTPLVESINVNMRIRCESCGHRRDVNGNATDKAIEERINSWEKSGRVFI